MNSSHHEDNDKLLARMADLFRDESESSHSNFLTHPERIVIHQRHQTQHLTKTLAAAYPKLHQHLGLENFRRLSLDYGKTHPCSEPILDQFGQLLPGFLTKSTYWARSPYLSKLAWFERMLQEISCSTNQTSPLDLDELRKHSQAASLANLDIYLNPSMQIIASDGDLWQLWHHPHSAWQSSTEPQWIAAWRTHDVQITVLPAPLAPLLDQVLKSKMELDQLCSQVATEQSLQRLQVTLGFGLEAGWLHAAPR